MVCILISSLLLAVKDFEDKDSTSTRNRSIDIVQKIFTIIFALESILKMVVMGVVVHQHSYFRTVWNIIDFFVVFTGLMEFSSS